METGAADDPEGESVLKEVLETAEGDPDIHVLSSGHYDDRTINALQRLADNKIPPTVYVCLSAPGAWRGKITSR